MAYLEKKYGFEEDERVKEFHRSRRMFCIHEGELSIADSNSPYSHATWFLKEGWMTEQNDGLMDEIVRGIVDDKGDVYIYTGYDFRINEKAEKEFFPHLKELAEILHLKTSQEAFGGLAKGNPGEMWAPIKRYGKISDLM